MNPHFETIWNIIENLPSGRVASYGQIALMAGLPGRARLVGRALRESPENRPLPWHRVLGANGRSAFPVDSPAYLEQRGRLLAEGVVFQGERVDFRRYGIAVNGLDAFLWGPDSLAGQD